MFTVHAKKKDKMSFTITIDQTKIARGHMTFPKAGRHKDKRRIAKVRQRADFRKSLG